MTTLLVNPSREDLEGEGKRHRLHRLMIDDLLGPRRHPKFARLAQHLWFSFWDIGGADDRAGIDCDITLIFNLHQLLVVQRGPAEHLRDLSQILENSDENSSPVSDVYRIFNAVVSDLVLIGADIETQLDNVEAEVFDTRRREDYASIYKLRKRIGRIDRCASGLADVLREADADLHVATEAEQELRPYFDHLREDASGVAVLAAAEHTALDAVVSSHESNVSTRQNKDMRTISAFAALLALPTVVASLYGMNTTNLPLAEWEFGWVVVVSAMVALDAVAFGLFWWRGWIGHSNDEEGSDVGAD